PAAADHSKHLSSRYLDAGKIDWVPLLAPPPAADSAQQQRDLQTVLDMQAANRSGERRDKAIADSKASCFRFADVLGPAFDEKQLPVTAAFLNRAANEADAVTGILKHHWQRARPFVVSDEVERMADVAPRTDKQDAASLHSFEYSSYPSGHATYGMACALLLTQLVPEKQKQLFQRAVEYSESRLIVGAHFPSDLLAGRFVATAAVTLMTQNSAFQHDVKAARKELQRTLELAKPPEPVAVTTRM
ncbi:MAG: phosphatase PAP2 family protein, partial [Steroidobacter sp.]